MYSMKKSAVAVMMVIMLALSACGGLFTEEATTQPVANTTEATLPAVNTAAPETETAETNDSAPIEIVGEAPVFDLAAQEQALTTLYEQVNPGVVHIRTANGEGSGFVYDAGGYIVTNNHVVAPFGEPSRQIVAIFNDGREYPAELVGRDPDSDLAVLRVEAEGLTALDLADSDALKVGQFAIAIGNPFGLQSSMTTGIISGLGRVIQGSAAPTGGNYNIPSVIQTDAAVNPGNSGGPLLDVNGRVIGVNTAIESPVRGSSGIGYAVPSNIVARVVPQLIETGIVRHPWLGIAGGSLNSQAAAELGLEPQQRGVFLSQIIEGGPGDRAGLQPVNPGAQDSGDVIIGIDGQTITDFDDLLSYVVQHTTTGQTVDLQVLRDGEIVTVPLTLGERPTTG